MTLDDYTPVNDRIIEYRGFKLVYTDPYGFVHIEKIGEGGALAQYMQGEFTGIHEAQKVIDRYYGAKEDKENKPPQDKATRKIWEMQQKGELQSVEPTKDMFRDAHEEKVKYVEKPKKDKSK